MNETEMRQIEFDLHKESEKRRIRENAIHTSLNLIQIKYGRDVEIDPSEIFKIASKIVKFIEKG